MRTEFRSFEARAVADNVVTGTLVTYGEHAKIGTFMETFTPGSLRYEDVIANLQHNRQAPLARMGAGLELRNSDTEIVASIVLPDTTHGRDAIELVRTKVLKGFSMEFRAVREKWSGNLRTISDAVLHGLALVDRPAYAGSTIEEIRQSGFLAPQKVTKWLYL